MTNFFSAKQKNNCCLLSFSYIWHNNNITLQKHEFHAWWNQNLLYFWNYEMQFIFFQYGATFFSWNKCPSDVCLQRWPRNSLGRRNERQSIWGFCIPKIFQILKRFTESFHQAWTPLPLISEYCIYFCILCQLQDFDMMMKIWKIDANLFKKNK